MSVLFASDNGLSSGDCERGGRAITPFAPSFLLCFKERALGSFEPGLLGRERESLGNWRLWRGLFLARSLDHRLRG